MRALVQKILRCAFLIGMMVASCVSGYADEPPLPQVEAKWIHANGSIEKNQWALRTSWVWSTLLNGKAKRRALHIQATLPKGSNVSKVSSPRKESVSDGSKDSVWIDLFQNKGTISVEMTDAENKRTSLSMIFTVVQESSRDSVDGSCARLGIDVRRASGDLAYLTTHASCGTNESGQTVLVFQHDPDLTLKPEPLGSLEREAGIREIPLSIPPKKVNAPVILAQFSLRHKSAPDLAKFEIYYSTPIKYWTLTPSVGFSYHWFSETAAADLSELLLRAGLKFGWEKPGFPVFFEAQARSQFPAIYVSRIGVTVSFMDGDLLAGARLPFVKDPWSLKVLGGFAYRATLSSGESLGYFNAMGPELELQASRVFGNGNTGSAYARFAPINGEASVLGGLDNREIAAGLSYELVVKETYAIPLTLEFSQLHLSAFGVTMTVIDSTAVSLSGGFKF